MAAAIAGERAAVRARGQGHSSTPSAEHGWTAALDDADKLYEPRLPAARTAQEGPRAFSEKRAPVWQGR